MTVLPPFDVGYARSEDVSEQKRYYFEREGRTLRFGETFRARQIAALKRFLFVSTAATFMMLAFLIPDYIGNYRKSDPTGGWLFLASIAAIGILLGTALGILRLVRAEHWELSMGKRELSFVSRNSKETVSLDEIAFIELREGALIMVLGEENQEDPMLQGGPKPELDAVMDAISALVGSKKALELRRADATHES